MLFRATISAGQMLQELKEAHGIVEACIREMEELTSTLVPDRLKYTGARYRISRASMARRACFNATVERLARSATSEELAILQRVTQIDRTLSSKSASHVLHWNPERIQTDWVGYCAASRRIRREMAEELLAEQTQLFPLLEKRSLEAKPTSRAA